MRGLGVFEPIEGAPDSSAATVEYVGVDHCRLQIAVPQQFLNGPDIAARTTVTAG